jgi:hypothetical protein
MASGPAPRGPGSNGDPDTLTGLHSRVAAFVSLLTGGIVLGTTVVSAIVDDAWFGVVSGCVLGTIIAVALIGGSSSAR